MDDMQIRRYNYLVNTGWLTPNEARKLMDLPHISDGDEPVIKIGIQDGKEFFKDIAGAICDRPEDTAD